MARSAECRFHSAQKSELSSYQMGSSSFYPLRDGFLLGSEPGDGDLSPCSPRFIRLAPLRCVPIFLGYVAFFILLGTGLFSRYWQYGRIVATRYGSIDATTATQLSINTTWFSLPRDIGTPESKYRDIGTSEHWNPECTGRGKGTDSRNRERAPTRGTVFFFQVPPWQSLAVSPLRVSLPSRSWRLRRPVVHVGCRYSFWSLFFPRL